MWLQVSVLNGWHGPESKARPAFGQADLQLNRQSTSHSGAEREGHHCIASQDTSPTHSQLSTRAWEGKRTHAHTQVAHACTVLCSRLYIQTKPLEAAWRLITGVYCSDVRYMI